MDRLGQLSSYRGAIAGRRYRQEAARFEFSRVHLLGNSSSVTSRSKQSQDYCPENDRFRYSRLTQGLHRAAEVEVFYEVRLYGVLGSLEAGGATHSRKNSRKKVAHSLEFIRNSSACAFLFDGMEAYGALVGGGERQGARSCAPVKTAFSWLGRYIKARGGLMAWIERSLACSSKRCVKRSVVLIRSPSTMCT